MATLAVPSLHGWKQTQGHPAVRRDGGAIGAGVFYGFDITGAACWFADHDIARAAERRKIVAKPGANSLRRDLRASCFTALDS